MGLLLEAIREHRLGGYNLVAAVLDCCSSKYPDSPYPNPAPHWGMDDTKNYTSISSKAQYTPHLFCAATRSGSLADWTTFKKIRKECNAAFQKAKINYKNQLCAQLEQDATRNSSLVGKARTTRKSSMVGKGKKHIQHFVTQDTNSGPWRRPDTGDNRWW